MRLCLESIGITQTSSASTLLTHRNWFCRINKHGMRNWATKLIPDSLNLWLKKKLLHWELALSIRSGKSNLRIHLDKMPSTPALHINILRMRLCLHIKDRWDYNTQTWMRVCIKNLISNVDYQSAKTQAASLRLMAFSRNLKYWLKKSLKSYGNFKVAWLNP